MFKKKKISQKQTINQLHQRHILHLNLPSFSAQESRVKTLPSAELKSLSKTIDLHKDTLGFKKNISRKTTSRTIKMDQSLRPSNLNNILKNIKSIRSNAYNELSKSKSPARPKSKSTKKLCPKNKSENRLSLKIDNTLRKMNFCEIFVDQESNVVFPSASTRPHLKHNLSNLSELDDIDIQQIKKFRTAVQPQERLKVEIKSGDSLQETVAAITIQRAWRKYKTKQLVLRYTQNNLSYLFGSNRSISSAEDPFAKLQSMRQELVIVPSDDFYGQTVQQDVKQISNLQDSSSIAESDLMEEKVKSIKLQQLQKWNDILTMIQATKNTTQQERQRIFSQIARQSERNRQQLIQMTDLSKSARKESQQQQLLNKFKSNQLQQPMIQQQHYIKANLDYKLGGLDPMDSGQRVKLQSDSQSDTGYYNANKYIQYLNVDVFPDSNHQNSNQSGLLGINTISNHEKQLLIQFLKARPVKLPYDRHSSALGFLNFHDMTPKQEPQSAKINKNLRRSTSERMLRRNLSEISSFEQEDIVNLEMLQEQYLENYPILIEDNEQNSYEVHLPPDFSGELRQQKKLESPDISSKQETIIHKQVQELFDDLVKLQRQEHNASISSEQTLINHQQHEQRVDNLATIFLNTLAMEVLHDVARSKLLTTAIKQFYNHSKPKVRRTSEGQKKKKGFPTDKKEIDLFLHNFTSFLVKEEFGILKNLQIATGPTALEMLRYMHVEDQDSLEERSESQEPNIMVIPNRIFDAFWKIKEKSIIVEVPSDFTEEHSAVFRQNIEYLKSFNKIFYRSLFDTFNQCLDHERNFGILGKPFPWKKASTFQHVLSDQAKKQSLERARTKMVSYATTYCGLIIDTQEVGSTVGNEQYLQQVQQDRLSRMLATDLLESQVRWQFYDDEEAEILIQISNVIYRELLFQVLELLCQFQ